MKKTFALIILLLLFTPNYFVLAQVADTDNDGLSDDQELIYHTNPHNPDTDSDGFSDGEEVANGYSPLAGNKAKLVETDSDNDGLNDAWEIKLGSDLLNPDTDSDGFSDGEEVKSWYSPTNPNPVRVKKLIKVDIAKFTLTYYHDGKELDSILVATGKPSTPTPRGDFKIMAHVPVKNYTHLPNTKWNLQFFTGKNKLRYYIHGAYWHNLFGKKNVSGGCVNVAYKDMQRLYDWASDGMQVIIN